VYARARVCATFFVCVSRILVRGWWRGALWSARLEPLAPVANPNRRAGLLFCRTRSPKGYTFASPKIEYYLGKNTKDAYGCKGSGGTACMLCNDKSRYGYRFRIWTIE